MSWIFILITMTSLWVLGATIVTQQDMLLHSIRDWANEKSADKPISIYDAIIKCPWCMPSIHGIFGYTFSILTGAVHVSKELFIAYPIVVCGASIVSGMIWTIYIKMQIQIKHLEHIEQLSYFDIKDRKNSFQKISNSKN